MMGKKKLSEIKAELAELLRDLPGKSPQAWFANEIKAAKKDPNRDVKTLEMLCSALEQEAKSPRKPKPRRRRAKPA